MSFSLTCFVTVFLFLIISQFGGRLAARLSLSWWLTFAFLLVSVIAPNSLHPVAHFLGIQLISNFVLGAMVVILVLHGVEVSANTTYLARKFRDLVSNQAILAGIQGAPLKKGEDELGGAGRVLVVCPCYNEEESLPLFLESVKQFKRAYTKSYDFLIVNDGSQDSSKWILENARAAPFSYISHPINIGVSGVILTGFKIACQFDYEYVVQCDTDGQHPVQEIPKLIQCMRDQKVDLLVGSRFCDIQLQKGALQSTTWLRRLGSICLLATLRLFGSAAKVTDPTSGFRVYSKSAYKQLIPIMPDEYPEPEMIALIASRGGSIHESSVQMRPRLLGESSISGFATIQYMIKVISALIGLRLRTLHYRFGKFIRD